MCVNGLGLLDITLLVNYSIIQLNLAVSRAELVSAT